MSKPSHALESAIHALNGESDLNIVRLALNEPRMARVLATAASVHPTVSAVALLCSDLPTLMDPSVIDDPALHDALDRLIGTSEGYSALRTLVDIAPAGWGAAHTTALVNAVHNTMCDARIAAALIGPNDESARLLSNGASAAFAIRRWGQSTPDTPTAWMNALSAAERDRLLSMVRCDPFSVARCLPWLPPKSVRTTTNIKRFIGDVIAAFAAASPTARAQHAPIMHQLVAQAEPALLGGLTSLACAMQSEQIWLRVQTIMREHPDHVERVVVAVPWDDLPETVRTVAVALNPAIAAAQGQRSVATLNAPAKSAAAFFAALDPKVWDALPAAEQRRWRDALGQMKMHLAVRSLGLRPDLLVQAHLDNFLVLEAQRHVHDTKTLLDILLPVALCSCLPDEAYNLIAAMPTLPPDHGALFCIVSGRGDADVIPAAATVLRTPDDLALAVLLQNIQINGGHVREAWASLHRALRGRTWQNLEPMMSLLSDADRAAFIPNPDALVDLLAHPDRQETLHAALTKLASLPPNIAIPVWWALHRWGTKRTNVQDARDAAGMVARFLCDHGDVFMDIVDSFTDDRRAIALPLPNDAALANALCDFARADPPSAQHLASVLRMQHYREALRMLITCPLPHAIAIWQALNERIRCPVVDETSTAKTTPDPFIIRHPVVSLALAAVQSGDHDLQNAGIAMLSERLDVVRTIWNALPSELQQTLSNNLSIAVCVADIPHDVTEQRTRRPRR